MCTLKEALCNLFPLAEVSYRHSLKHRKGRLKSGQKAVMDISGLVHAVLFCEQT